MSGQVVLGTRGVFALLILALVGCAPVGGPAATATPTPSPTPTQGTDGPRVLIECFYPDGSPAATFTRLEEAWASTNYMRIDHCEARAASENFELTAEEAEVAAVAAAGLPEEDPTELFLRTLAACVRIPAEGTDGMTSIPTSILQATLVLCPESPQAGLVEQELASRG